MIPPSPTLTPNVEPFIEKALTENPNFSEKGQGKEIFGYRLHIATYGCEMNAYDSLRMENLLQPLGFQLTSEIFKANVVIINTCDIREKAEEKLFSQLGRLRDHKEKMEKEDKVFVIVVAGCIPQRLGVILLQKAPFVDVLLGPQTYHTLPETLIRLLWRHAEKKWIQEERQKLGTLVKTDSTEGSTCPSLVPSSQALRPLSQISFKASPDVHQFRSFTQGTLETLPSRRNLARQKKDLPVAIASRPAYHLALGFPKVKKFDELPQMTFKNSPFVGITIQEGCGKFCKFCVVPYTRGPEYSRPSADILKEIQSAVQQGAKEITLLGQNVNAYRGKDPQGNRRSLGDLLFDIANFLEQKNSSDITKSLRIRYMTSHPRDMHDRLYQAHRDLAMVMPMVHLPAQSGSEKILQSMNRKYTPEDYLKVIEKFKSYRDDIAFSSDFIVGYPGETSEDFQDTCHFVEKIGFAQAFSFCYSPRQGTPAATLPLIETQVQKERLHILQDKLSASRLKFNESFVGKSLPIVLERWVEKKVDGPQDTPLAYWTGRSPWMHSVRLLCEDAQDFSTSLKAGQEVWVYIQRASPHNLYATTDSGLKSRLL